MLIQIKSLNVRNIALALFLCLLIAELTFVGTSIHSEGRPRFIPYGYSRHEFTNDSLVVVMPINENTDTQFYRNQWLGDYLHTVCDFDGPDCSLSCNAKSTYETLDKKTMCFTNILKQEFKHVNFFIKLDDDALVDKEYVRDMIEKYKGYNQPVYISDFILNLDGHNPVLNGSYYGNGKFYMFNRALLDCINTEIKYKGRRNEDAIFGAMVYNGCGPNVLKITEDDSKIWHKQYENKNKKIDLSALTNH